MNEIIPILDKISFVKQVVIVPMVGLLSNNYKELEKGALSDF